MEHMDKWYHEYIENIDIEKIEWVRLNALELDSFITDNYFDKSTWDYVYDKNACKCYPTLLGMSYLSFNNPLNDRGYSFLLGIVDNNIGKKTVVAATIYLDEYMVFTTQEKPATYISTMEVNSFFRERGIYKKMCGELINFVNPDQHILTTSESDIGRKCRAFDILKNTLLSNGFKNWILMDNHDLIYSELYDVLCSKKKVLK